MNTIYGSPNLPRFDSEQSAECFASHYLEPGEPITGANIARAARRWAERDPITAARLERAVKTVLFGPTWTWP